MPAIARYAVAGMTCTHCVSAVSAELGALPGVQSVVVDLVAGGESTVVVTSEARLQESRVQGAVDEAGYQLMGTRS